jgi:uncharacterized protein YcfJ
MNMNKKTLTHKLTLISVAVALTGIFGCATQMKQIKTGVIDTDPSDTVIRAKVVNIVEVKKDASLMKQFGGALVGAVIGSQIGGGSTPDILGTGFAFVGADLVNKKFGNLVDRLELEVSKEKSYKCLIYGHDFRVNDKVVATIKDGKVVTLLHEKDYDKQTKQQKETK